MSRVIPDAAVQAAGRALFEHNPRIPELQGMEDTPRDEFLCCAHAALEAAAPHMLAEAEEAGYNRALADMIALRPTSGPRPYR